MTAVHFNVASICNVLSHLKLATTQICANSFCVNKWLGIACTSLYAYVPSSESCMNVSLSFTVFVLMRLRSSKAIFWNLIHQIASINIILHGTYGFYKFRSHLFTSLPLGNVCSHIVLSIIIELDKCWALCVLIMFGVKWNRALSFVCSHLISKHVSYYFRMVTSKMKKKFETRK